MSQQPSINLQGIGILQLLTPEERSQLQTELQSTIDRWYRIKFTQLTMIAPGMNGKNENEVVQEDQQHGKA